MRDTEFEEKGLSDYGNARMQEKILSQLTGIGGAEFEEGGIVWTSINGSGGADVVSNGPTGQPGIGGAPTRATTLPEDPAERKKYPIASGFFDYFPDAIVAVSNISFTGNEQHNPGKPLHWDRSKSADEADTTLRHFVQRGTLDTDGKRHTAKAAWRILALLQKEIEGESR